LGTAFILIGLLVAALFVIAVARLFSPNDRQTKDGDIVSSTAHDGHSASSDCGSGGDGGGSCD